MRSPLAFSVLSLCFGLRAFAAELHINDLDYLDAQGLSILVYQNQFLIAYGNNRADYTFIPGGMIPGVVKNGFE
jgi:hypothetical protein